MLAESFKVFPMNPWIVAAWLVTTGSVVGLTGALIWVRFRTERNVELDTNPTYGGLSFHRYQVMERLLCLEDAKFIGSQPGISARARRANFERWKRDSVRIFRVYLGELTQDFNNLHAEARRMVAASHAESPELASVLVRQQLIFFRARVALEARLVLFELGIGSVDVAPLLHMIEKMQLDLGEIIPELTAA